MAQPSFVVKIEEGRVFVKHRVSTVLATCVGLGVVIIGLCMLPGSLHTLARAREYHSLADAFKAILGFCVPLFGAWIWMVMLHAGETMECDAKELHHARQKQRLSGGWQRRRFPVSDIRGLHVEMRAGSRTRYRLLTFACNGEKVEMLLGISQEDVDRILVACRGLGLDVTEAFDIADKLHA